MFGSPLSVPGEILDGGEIPRSRFLQKIELAVSGFDAPPPHHVSPAPPAPLWPALLAAKFMFVREDAYVPPLAPLYLGPYLVLEWRTKFFCLQLGDRTNVVSVDRLKPAFSDEAISLALLPLHGRPALAPAPVSRQPPPPLSAVVWGPVHQKSMKFHLPQEVPSRRKPHSAAPERRICSAVPSGGSTVADTRNLT